MIPPPTPDCQGQPMMTVIIKDYHSSEGRGAIIITAARHNEPTIRREAQVVGMIPPPAGLRRIECLWTLSAKRSLRRPLSPWSSDRPTAHQQVVG